MASAHKKRLKRIETGLLKQSEEAQVLNRPGQKEQTGATGVDLFKSRRLRGRSIVRQQFLDDGDRRLASADDRFEMRFEG